MYWCYREHHITPAQFDAMGEGEKRILKAFMIKEIDDINRQAEDKD